MIGTGGRRSRNLAAMIDLDAAWPLVWTQASFGAVGLVALGVAVVVLLRRCARIRWLRLLVPALSVTLAIWVPRRRRATTGDVVTERRVYREEEPPPPPAP